MIYGKERELPLKGLDQVGALDGFLVALLYLDIIDDHAYEMIINEVYIEDED